MAAISTSSSRCRKNSGGPIRIACDTEFEKADTLTAQFATRIGDKIIVQLYRSSRVTEPLSLAEIRQKLPDLSKWCSDIILRPVKVLTPDLSPVQVLCDLFRLDGVVPVPWQDGAVPVQDDGEAIGYTSMVKLAGSAQRTVKLQLIGHFLTADFLRCFGGKFNANLLTPDDSTPEVFVRSSKLLGFAGHNKYQPPIVEYALVEDQQYPVRLSTFDTNLPWGKAKLDSHAKLFLQLSKVDTVTQHDKARMEQTFRIKPVEAYTYAALDPILTLLVEERMRVAHGNLYRSLGFKEEETPKMRSTQGSGVSGMLMDLIRRAIAGSTQLSKNGKIVKKGIKDLLARGSSEALASLSRFGAQSGATHGGLLVNRSPDKIYDEAPGSFRDIDLSSCYGNILTGINLYVGRPAVLEPGSQRMTVKQAVQRMEKHAAGRDAWFAKVSGQASGNTLIPSTRDALTNANYRNRTAQRRAQARTTDFDDEYEGDKYTKGTRIYTDVIQGGIVTWATWLMIQALPKKLREEYERLEVDTLVWYPKRLVADSGEEYDRLYQQFATKETHWQEIYDMEELVLRIEERVTSDDVCFRFPLDELARQLMDLRKQAKVEHGPKSPAAEGLKLLVNTIYGVVASRHLATNNVVCANIITGTARALAFAMQTFLNGFQVITDGCIYRRDQIPACTFAECLKKAREYTIHRVEEGIPFIDPAKVPTDDAGFTRWYRQDVKKYFQVDGADYDRLFGIHDLEHKTCGEPKQASFDGLCLDGSAQYVKVLKVDGVPKPVDFKARGYRDEAKEKVLPWIMKTYTTDTYTGPPPITMAANLLKIKQANRMATGSFDELLEEHEGLLAIGYEGDPFHWDLPKTPEKVVFPLGMDYEKVLAYKVIKPSAYLFRTPEQERLIRKAMDKFAAKYACGLEALALQRSQGERRHGSINSIASAIYRFIREGGDDLRRKWNLGRSTTPSLEEISEGHAKTREAMKKRSRYGLIQAIDVRNLEDDGDVFHGFAITNPTPLPLR